MGGNYADVIGNYNYRVFGNQEYTTIGNKST